MARPLRRVSYSYLYEAFCRRNGNPTSRFSANSDFIDPVWSLSNAGGCITREKCMYKCGSTVSGAEKSMYCVPGSLPFVSRKYRAEFVNLTATRLLGSSAGSVSSGESGSLDRHDVAGGSHKGEQTKSYRSRKAKPTGKTYHVLMAAKLLKELEQARNKEERLGILRSRKVRELSIRKFWLCFIDVLRKSANPELAVEAFNWQRKELKKVDSPNLYAKMISLAGTIRKPQLAVSWFEDMANRKLKKSTSTCNALIFAFSKNNEPEMAMKVFQSMKSSKTCEPNVVTYNVLLSMYGALGELEKMENVLEDCSAAGFSPDRITCNTLLYAYLKNGKLDKMDDIYNMMLANSCEPDVITFNALMLGHCRAVSVEKMEACLTDMQNRNISVTGMVAEEMVRVYMKTGMVDRVDRVIDIVEGSPEGRYTTQLHNVILECFASAGKLDSIEAHFERILKRKQKFASSSALEGVINAFVSQNDFERLHTLYKKLNDSQCWVLFSSTFDLLIVEYSKGGFLEKIEELLGDMETAGHKPSTSTLQAIHEARIRAGDETGAQEIKHRMSQDDSFQNDFEDEFFITVVPTTAQEVRVL